MQDSPVTKPSIKRKGKLFLNETEVLTVLELTKCFCLKMAYLFVCVCVCMCMYVYIYMSCIINFFTSICSVVKGTLLKITKGKEH
jgi:hypothetical protein